MRDIGFSTGALAYGDFRRALHILEGHSCPAIELSALRESELQGLMEALDELSIDEYMYVSVHAPSRRKEMSEKEIAELLLPCIDRAWPIILHPDAIQDHGCWRQFGELACLENMDGRKASGRNVAELEPHFRKLPEATLCLDLGHAQQVDPTLGVVRAILRNWGSRLRQIHLSELNANSKHEPLSMMTVWAVQDVASIIPPAPVILESVIGADQIDAELKNARACFEVKTRTRHKAAVSAATLA